MTNHKFNLERAKAGEDVVTRDGRKARIVCFDRESKLLPIVALITNRSDGNEVCDCFEINGAYPRSIDSHNDLFMAAPSIPDGFIKYDPNVPPPEMAAELEMFYICGKRINSIRSSFIDMWKADKSGRTHYRVTKWKLPEGFKPHMGGERPADAVGSGKVCFANGSIRNDSFLECRYWPWEHKPLPLHIDIIGYLPDAKDQDLDSIIQELCEVIGETDHIKILLNQFAAAIIAECKKQPTRGR